MRVVIVGGGFGGAFLAHGLGKRIRNRRDIEVVLVSKTNYLLFQPFMVEAVVGEIEVRHLMLPLRQLLKFPSVRVVRDEVVDIDLEGRAVKTAGRAYPYDRLVMAVGSRTNFWGVPGAKEHCIELKSAADVFALRSEILDRLERAALEEDPERQRALLTFAIVGAGPSGIELAGLLHDSMYESFLPLYPSISRDALRILLVDASPVILPAFDQSLIRWAQGRMRERDVDLRLGNPVERVTGQEIHMKGGEKIPVGVTVWCTGVKAHPLVSRLGDGEDPLDRVRVDEYLRIPAHPNVYVLGDAALCADPKTGQPLPPEAQVALQQARCLAKNFVSEARGERAKPFRFFRIGRLASIGSRNAVTQILWFRFRGFIAWWLWRSVYLVRFKGIRSKAQVVADWTLSLFFGRQTALVDWKCED
jgi:NADH dehydrogenase